MLLFPPEWRAHRAVSGAAESDVGSFARMAHDVIQKDVNIEMYELFFQRRVF